MKFLNAIMLIFLLLGVSNSFAVTVGYVENGGNQNMRQACTSGPGLWGFLKPRCVDFKIGDRVPTAEEILAANVKKTSELVVDDAQALSLAQANVVTYTEKTKNLQMEEKKISKEIGNLSGSINCDKVKPDEKVSCFQKREEESARLKNDATKKNRELQATRDNLQTFNGNLNQATAEAQKAGANIKTISNLENQILNASNLTLDLDKLEDKFEDHQKTLDVIEKSLSNSLLEAYVCAKMTKLSQNFCDAQTACSSKNGDSNEGQKALMKGLFDEQNIQKSLSKPQSDSSRK